MTFSLFVDPSQRKIPQSQESTPWLVWKGKKSNSREEYIGLRSFEGGVGKMWGRMVILGEGEGRDKKNRETY